MTVKVLAFGIVKEIMGGASAHVQVPAGATTHDLKSLLELQYPRLHQLASYLVAVNNEYAAAGATITEQDEIALIPPVSGG